MKKRRFGDTNTNLVLSDKAQQFYNGADPIDIYEYDDGDVCHYTLKLWGDRESSQMTAEEINAELEAIAESLDCEDDDE